MDALGLTNKFLIETGVTDQVQSLEDASDDVIQAFHWVDSAWASFQREKHWPFRRAEGSISITNGKTSYTFDDLSLQEGDIILPHTFYNSAGTIDQLSYYALRELRRAADSVDLTRVYKVAVRAGLLESYPDVATTQVVDFDFLKGVQTLAENTDIPYGLPADFHMLIVHRAVAKHGALIGGEEGANLYKTHGLEYSKIKQDYLVHAGIDDEGNVPETTNTLA